jgi:hypothetical protein
MDAGMVVARLDGATQYSRDAGDEWTAAAHSIPA